MSARLHSAGTGQGAGMVQVSAAELAELRDLAAHASTAYAAGLADGRERLAEELGVTLPPRIRTQADDFAACSAALVPNVLIGAYQLGRQNGLAEATEDRDSGQHRVTVLRLASGSGTPGGAA